MLIVIGLLYVLLLEVANCAKVSPICPTGTPAVDTRGQYTYCAASADAPSSCPGDDEGLSYCSELGLCCCNDSSATCPNCMVPLNCSSDVCEAKTCPNYPKARCLVNYCASCEPRFFVGKEEVTASCLEPPQCKGKMYGGHCLDDDCVLMEVNGELTDRCRQRGGECLVDLNNNVRCFTDVPRKKPPKKDDDDEEEEEEEEEEDDCHPLPYCPPDKPTRPPRPTPPDDDDDDDDTVSTVSTATGTTTTGTGTTTTGTGTTTTGTGTTTTGTGTTTTGTGTTDTASTATALTADTASTGTASTDTASTGTASTATTNDGTASTATTKTASTGTASTDTASTGTASTATTNDDTASTATTQTASSGTASTGTASSATTNDDTASTGTTNTASTGSTGTAATGTTKGSTKSSKKGSKGKRHLRSMRKDDYERNVSEDNPHYYRRYQRYYYDN